jgi:transcriptional regulator with XRE-family HTH domain
VTPVTAFSLRLKQALAEKEMTQEALARELGLSLRAVQGWCAGSEPRGRALLNVSRVLGREPAWFFAPADIDVSDERAEGQAAA